MSKKEEDHIADLKETFGNLRATRLKLNLEKCVFRVSRGKMLRCIIGPEGIHANPPSTKKEVQKLTDRIAALNRFISKSAEHSLPFFKALRSIDNLEWGPEQSKAFQQLKSYLASNLMVTVLGPDAPLLLYVAVVDHIVTGVLVQEKKRDSKITQQPVYYISEDCREQS
jgi:hypothetical protein